MGPDQEPILTRTQRGSPDLAFQPADLEKGEPVQAPRPGRLVGQPAPAEAHVHRRASCYSFTESGQRESEPPAAMGISGPRHPDAPLTTTRAVRSQWMVTVSTLASS